MTTSEKNIAVKRRIVWCLSNATMQTFTKYNAGNVITSDTFTILLGENKTEW